MVFNIWTTQPLLYWKNNLLHEYNTGNKMHYKSKKVNSNINNSGLPNLQEFFFTHPKL